jgi:hypothetical protein
MIVRAVMNRLPASTPRATHREKPTKEFRGDGDLRLPESIGVLGFRPS